MVASIFISYSRKDKQFAQNLVHTLEQYGLDTWFDSDDIRAGEDWSDAIQRGLDESSVMIVVISPDSMKSPNVGDEWKYFLDKDKAIIPVLHRPSDNIHFQLRRIQYIDFVNLPFDEALQKLIYEMRQNKIVVGESPQPRTTLPKPKPVERKLAPNKLLYLSLLLIPIIAILAYLNWPDGTSTEPSETPEASAEASPEPTELVLSATPEATAEPSATSSFGIVLDIPYVSQFDENDPYNNDDGPAALLMALKWFAQSDSALASRIEGLSFAEVARGIGMTTTTNTVSFSSLMVYAENQGVPNELCRRITRERIFEELDNARPVLMLVDYEKLRPEVGFGSGHFVLVAGYDEGNVILYDSHNRVRPNQPMILEVSYAAFEDMIVNIPNNLNYSQGIIFGEGNTCEVAN